MYLYLESKENTTIHHSSSSSPFFPRVGHWSDHEWVFTPDKIGGQIIGIGVVYLCLFFLWAIGEKYIDDFYLGQWFKIDKHFENLRKA